MKSTKIIVAVLAVFITASCTGYKLAPGSYKVGKFTSTLPKEEYILTSPTEFPEGSIYSHTDDFVLQTKNLPKPKITREYDESFTFTPYKDGNFEKSGELEEAWRVEFVKDVVEPYNKRFMIYVTPKSKDIFNIKLSYDHRDERNKEKNIDPKSGEEAIEDNSKWLEKKKILRNTVYNVNHDHCLVIDEDNLSLVNSRNEILWHQKVKNFSYYIYNFDDLIMRNNNLIFHDGYKIYCLDLSCGEVKWILFSENRLLYSHVIRYSPDNIWMLFADIYSEDGKELTHWEYYKTMEVFKLNLDTLEIVNVDVPSKNEIKFVGDYFYNEKDDTLREYLINTGQMVSEYTPPDDLENGFWQFDSANPFFSFFMTEDKERGFKFFNKKNNTALDVIDYYSENSEYTDNLKKNVRIQMIFFENKYFGFDDKEFFGFDPETATRTWTISKEKTGDDAYITYIGEDGVFIVDGATLYCYR